MSSKRSKLPYSPEALDWRYHYKETILGTVVTGAEVTEIWNVPRATLDRAWSAGEVEARKSITGGTVLFTVRSIIAKFGKPSKDYLTPLSENPNQLTLFALDNLLEQIEGK